MCIRDRIKIGGLQLANRLLMTPMGTELGTHDGHSTPAEAAYYAERAKGGTGLVMTGINFVSGVFDPIAPGLARIDTDAHTPGIRAIAEAVHEAGGVLALQLTMGLGRNKPVLPDPEHGAAVVVGQHLVFRPERAL